jgi:two-component system, NarL family, sensor histidine kinase UhpB
VGIFRAGSANIGGAARLNSFFEWWRQCRGISINFVSNPKRPSRIKSFGEVVLNHHDRMAIYWKSMKIGVVCTIVFVWNLWGPFAFGQTQDSTLLEMGSSAFSLASQASDSALVMGLQAFHESRKVGYRRGEANAANAIGWTWMHKGNLDSAVFYLRHSKTIFAQENLDFDLARVSINLSEVYNKQSRFAEALEAALEAESISEKLGNIPLLTDTKRLLAILYREKGEYAKSVENFQAAIKGFEEQKDTRRSINTAISLSILLRKMDQPDSSLSVLNRCLALLEREENLYQMAMVREHLGETYYMKGQVRASLAEYEKAYDLFVQLGNMADVAYEAMVVGKAYGALGDFGKSEEFLRRAYDLSDSLGLRNYQFDASSELSQLYQQTQQWKKATDQLQLTLQLKDTLAQNMQIQKMSELTAQYENEKKEQEIALLRSNMELEAVKSRRQRQFQYFLLALIPVLGGFGYLIFNRAQLKQKLEEQTLRNQLSKDLHDDIGSTLSSISINSRIALMKVDEKDFVAQQLEKIQQNSKAILDNMSHIVWSINPANDSLEMMVFKMRDFASEILEPLGINFQFDAEGLDLKAKISPAIRKNLYLIFKESLNNASKYSKASEIKAKISTIDGNIILLVSDNGQGFSVEDEQNRGNGLRNMRERAAQIKGNISVDSQIGKGTHIKLSVPSPHWGIG